jgi:hypothetical protein
MSDSILEPVKSRLPLKNLAGALLFSVFLGPIGLLYASTLGGTVMIFLSFFALSNQLFIAIGIFWLVSCIWKK